MGNEIYSNKVDNVSYSLVNVVKALNSFFFEFSNKMRELFEPRLLLQSLDGDPESVDAVAFRNAISSLYTHKINLVNVLNTFKRDVFGQVQLRHPHPEFAVELQDWILRARDDMEKVLKRVSYPEEAELVEKTKEVYFEAIALVKEFNALISTYNSRQSDRNIPLIITSGLDVVQEAMDKTKEALREEALNAKARYNHFAERYKKSLNW